MRYRVLGKTGMKVSEIGFGGHLSQANRQSPDQRARQIDKALDLGINYFDTTHDFEAALLTQALRKLNRRDECIVTGMDVPFQNLPVDTSKAEGKRHVLKEAGRILRILESDAIDVYHLCACQKNYGDALMEGAMEALEELKKEGKVRFFGISDHRDGTFMVRMIERYGDILDTINFRYNFVDRGATERVFPAAAENNLGVIVIKPFAGGSLLRLKPSDQRLKVLDMVGEKSIAHAALKFILAEDAISIVIPAMNSVEEVVENADASG